MRLNPFRLLLSFPVLLILALLLAAPVWAGEGPMLFILDSSGSMWGRLGDGRAKIEAAREVLGEILSSLPSERQAGLMAYGHRRKGDCADIELLYPVQSGQSANLAAAVRDILPRGKTPIADSLTQAAGSCEAGRGFNLVLVSDGKETCGGDPCAVAEKIHASGADVRIFVVGFQVTGEDVGQLRCIAEKGGGSYFQADDAASLAEALASIEVQAAGNVPVPEQEPAPQPPAQPVVTEQAQTTTRIKLQAIGSIQLEPASWVRMPPRHWKIIDAESAEEVGAGQGESIKIKPGAYQVLWRQAEHGSEEVPLTETVFVQAGATATLKLDTGLRLTAPEGIGPAYYWKLVDSQGETVAKFWGDETYQAQLAPAGSYSLVWRQTEHGSGEVDLGQVDIATGQLAEKVLDSGIVLTLPDWLQEPYRYTLTDSQGRECSMNLQGPQVLGPGEYSLVWRQTEHGHSPVAWGSITVPEHGFTPLPVNSGLVFVAEGQKPPYRITASNTRTGEKADLKQSWGPLPLPAGEYSLDYQETEHGGEPIRLIDGLAIRENELLELEI